MAGRDTALCFRLCTYAHHRKDARKGPQRRGADKGIRRRTITSATLANQTKKTHEHADGRPPAATGRRSMEPAFGALEYAVEVHGGGKMAGPARILVKRLPKRATVALLHKRIAAAHAKRYPTRPTLHFALAPCAGASHNLVDSRGTVLVASDKVASSSLLHAFFLLSAPSATFLFFCVCVFGFFLFCSALLGHCRVSFPQPCFFLVVGVFFVRGCVRAVSGP